MSLVAAVDHHAVVCRRLTWSFIAQTGEASMLCRVLVVCEGVVIKRCCMVREHRENRVCVTILLPAERVDEVLHNVMQHINNVAVGRIDAMRAKDEEELARPGLSAISKHKITENPRIEPAYSSNFSPVKNTGSNEESASMNPLAELLSPEDILLDLDVLDKEDLIGQMAGFFERRHGMEPAITQRCLAAREALGSTGIGHGFAIPHARVPGLDRHLGVLIRIGLPIPFEAPDDKPASIFLGLLLPENSNEIHLALLATAAKLFSMPDFRIRLNDCADVIAVHNLLRDRNS